MTAPGASGEGATGYLEESPGVRSMSRLFILTTLAGAILGCVLLALYVVYVLLGLHQQPVADVVRAFGWVITALGGSGSVGVATRNLGA